MVGNVCELLLTISFASSYVGLNQFFFSTDTLFFFVLFPRSREQRVATMS
jgi:hypothetical protein